MKKTKNMVEKILAEYPEARDDDFVLIALVYDRNYDIKGKSFFEIMMNHKAFGLPSLESIRRTRQKLQEDMPLVYGASGEARQIRAEEEKRYRKEYGRNS